MYKIFYHHRQHWLFCEFFFLLLSKTLTSIRLTLPDFFFANRKDGSFLLLLLLQRRWVSWCRTKNPCIYIYDTVIFIDKLDHPSTFIDGTVQQLFDGMTEYQFAFNHKLPFFFESGAENVNVCVWM
jgi:hypothetical protein